MTAPGSNTTNEMSASEGMAPVFRDHGSAIAQDWQSVSRLLARHGHAFDPSQPVRQFAGGFGNLNYLVEIDGENWVLRRPPLGPIPPGANDMAREFRVLSALSPNWPLAPRPLLFHDDVHTIGAPFLIMEYRPGLVIGGSLPASVSSEMAGPALSQTLVRLLASLHGLDAEATGLGDFGRPARFLERAVAGWIKRADLAIDGAKRPPAMQAVAHWLTQHSVPKGGVTLLHNDFKLDNVILDPATLSPLAVIDWDMGSRGDPLFDVATLLSYWAEPDDPPCMHRLSQMPTAAPGFWTRHDVVDSYAKETGRDVSNIAFYRILTMFKLAVVFLQLDARQRASGTPDPRLASLQGLGDELMDFTCELLNGGRDPGGAL